jgi:Protein of unknown function, DUF547
MTPKKTKQWKKLLAACIFAVTAFLTTGFISAWPIPKTNTAAMPDTLLLKLSEEFLYAVKQDDSTKELEEQLANLNYGRLHNGLNNDNAIKTFWLNMYNGWFQVLAAKRKLKNPEIFKSKQIIIASKKFSLDDIEHGILRKFRWKYSKGYLPSFFPGKTIKQLAVEKIDYRIHFALNCGAKSCPAIAFYTYNNIDKQLNQAAKVFLKSETDIDSINKTVSVTMIMSWFAGDFGGKTGTLQIINKTLQQDVSGYKIIYKPYNWDALLHNFSEEKGEEEEK